MPFPGDLATITVTGSYPAGNAAPLTGQVTFTPSTDLVDTTGHAIIRAAPVIAELYGGAFTVPLLCTDNADISPSGWYWIVTEQIAGAPTRTYNVLLPHTGSSVDLSTLAPVSPGPAVSSLYGVLAAPNTNTWGSNQVFDGGIQIPAGAVAGGVATSDAQGNMTWQPGGGTQAWQFHVAAYGAKGDNATDDTAAINSAVTAAVTYAQAHNGYAEVVFDPLTYLIASAPTTGGATQGSAQIPLPVIAQSAQKVVLVLRGTLDQSALYHWLQAVPQRAGTVLRSTYSAGDAIPATGEASVIGGPSPHYVNNPPTVWNNMLIVVDGIGIEIPATVDVCGFDFRGMAEANVPNAAVLAAQTGTGAPPLPQPNWAFGLAMPLTNNNDNCNIGLYSCEGMVYGLLVYEHVRADSLRLINCYDGLTCFSESGLPHRSTIGYASIEGCQQSIVFAGSFNKLDVGVADLEWGAGHIVNDASATPAVGRIGLCSNGGSGTSLSAALSTGATAVNVVNGALALEITNLDQALGPVAAPGIPASGTPLVNPFWREAQIHITGGTVTQVAVDGVTQLSTSGAFTLPSGHSITLTYSAAPSWAWTLTR